MGEKVAMVQNWFSGMKSSLDYMLDTLCYRVTKKDEITVGL